MPHTYDEAKARVNTTPELDAHSETILYDWPEGDEHWEWVCTAEVAEIADWAESVENQGNSVRAIRDRHLCILVTVEERRRYHVAAATAGTTVSAVARDYLERWAAEVMAR